MPVFQVRQSATGAILWTGSAAGEIQALDAMAHEAGYYDHSDIPDGVRHGGLAVEALGFGSGAASASANGRKQGERAGRSSDRSGYAAQTAKAAASDR
jgi:hypothetical protein